MSEKLRVLSLATLYPNELTPGFGVFVERQMRAVMARGDVEVTVINPIGLPPYPLSLHPRYRALTGLDLEDLRCGVYTIRPHFTLLPRIGGRFNAGAIARAVLPLARQLHARRPYDLVDAQFFYPDGPAAVRIAAALGLPCSIKARGSDIHLWGRKSGTVDQVRKAGMAATGLLAVAEGLADDMANLGIPREKITIHRTGLDRALFRPLERQECRARLNLPADAPLLACVGALIPRKGQRLALTALAELPGVHLAFAGGGSDLATLRAMAEAKGLSDRVHFLGVMPHAELPQLLSAADVFVLPTESEGLANAWVEALACGTPVVTSDIPGARELLTDPAWGHMVAREPGAIASAVRDLLADPPSREVVQRGAAGFSWEANAAALVAHWQGLVEAGRHQIIVEHPEGLAVAKMPVRKL